MAWEWKAGPAITRLDSAVTVEVGKIRYKNLTNVIDPVLADQMKVVLQKAAELQEECRRYGELDAIRLEKAIRHEAGEANGASI